MPALTFTRRELQIVQALSERKSGKAIAEAAGSKEETVAGHIDALKAKLAADQQQDIPRRFTEMTGWANKPTDYGPTSD